MITVGLLCHFGLISALAKTIGASPVTESVSSPLSSRASTTCPRHYGLYTYGFEGLGVDKNGVTHPVRPHQYNVYKGLQFSKHSWAVASPGNQTIKPFCQGEPCNFNMTVYSGKLALVSATAKHGGYFSVENPHPGAPPFFQLQSVWIRSQSGAAFQLKLYCYRFLSDGSLEGVTYFHSVPYRPYGEYVNFVLTEQEKRGVMQQAQGCQMSDKSGKEHIMIDDLEICLFPPVYA